MQAFHFTGLSFTMKYIDLCVFFALCVSRCLTFPASSPSLLYFCLCLCFSIVCIVSEVFCPINLPLCGVSELASFPPFSTLTVDHPHSTHGLLLFPSSFLSPTAWTRGCMAPVRQSGDHKVSTQEESSSNLLQGDAGSVAVQIHLSAWSQYESFSSLFLLRVVYSF